MIKRNIFAALLLVASLPLMAQNTAGTWTTSFELGTGEMELTVVPPLGNDNALNCNRNAIPVKFAATMSGDDLLLVSDLSDSEIANDFGAITFEPTETLTVSELTNLTAIYAVVEGDCGGGSLRWSIVTAEGNVFVYYGATPGFTDCSGDEGQSGVNLLSLDDARVDSSQVYAGTQVNTWDAFVAANPDLVVEEVILVADGGWSQADLIQSFDITSATVNDNTFTGEATECDLPDAEIRVTDEEGNEVEVESVQGTSTMFRTDDCQYIYNLENPGEGTYTVEILVEGEVVQSTELTISCRGRGRSTQRGGRN
jgi:hypothetical protein